MCNAWGRIISVAVESFVARWEHGEGGQERANYALFLTELCDLIDVARPDPAGATHERNDYVFERAVTRHKEDGDTSGRIDLYKKNSFVLEAKQSRFKGGKKEAPGQPDAAPASAPRGRRGANRAWDVLMLNARRQAQEYARALPASHDWPPFILVCDVGHCIEVYADFSGQGKNYTQFPDRQGFRIHLEDLRNAEVRARLKAIWLAPQSLDPAQVAAKVTRSIAKRLAQVSLALEQQNHPPEEVATFLMRCLFTMFAEDVGLLPARSFKDILHRCESKPETFVPIVTQLWQAMDKGGFAHALQQDVRRFNGAFFENSRALPLGREEIGELRQAASHSWKDVDPAIFGTLLEQALDPQERKKLGAHYTPRAYVERLVVATVIEPLREDWRNVQAAAETLRGNGELVKAAALVRTFHEKLCRTRVLDPACGTGNFLYVALELMKRLEGEVLEALTDLGGQEALRELSSHSIGVRQFLGMEINPRAVAIAELVLWIGYLQWHFRTQGGMPNEPVLQAFGNITTMNAVLAWDGAPNISRVKGKEVYPNPRRPDWPQAEFIVGNPPFIGNKRMRNLLGDRYLETLHSEYAGMESSDFVMYWWDHAANLLHNDASVLQRFGFVTTNSITQTFNRRVIDKHLSGDDLSIVHAYRDHPWTTSMTDAAAVRIAMTVVAKGRRDGISHKTLSETQLKNAQQLLAFGIEAGRIHSDLTVGANVAAAGRLQANAGISHQGVILVGDGFRLTRSELRKLGFNPKKLPPQIRRYVIGRDIVQRSEERYVIDFFGLSSTEARKLQPKLFQIVLHRVKPQRDQVNRQKTKDIFWIYAEPRRLMRDATKTLSRYIATCRTAKHRLFQFLDTSVLPDAKIVAIAMQDSFDLGILSSRIHLIWAESSGARLGVGNDLNYNHSECFSKFPFPDANNIQKHTIRIIADDLDAHRKRVIDEHAHLTMTGLYNVRDDLRAGIKPDNLSDKHRIIFDDGLVLILNDLHDRLDVAVAEAYGWPADLADDQILRRLVALNTTRTEEEVRGEVRWLRPDYQIPRFAKFADKQAVVEQGAQIAARLDLVDVRQKLSFPDNAVEQTAAVFAALASASSPQDARTIAAHFRKTKTVDKKIEDVLWSLARLGHVTTDGTTFMLRRVA